MCAGMMRRLARVGARRSPGIWISRRQTSGAPRPQQSAEAAEKDKTEIYAKVVIVLIIALTAKDIANQAGQRAENIARMSKSGSAEEKEALEKTEKMAHAAALGSANGASDALKNRWWLLWPWELLWGPSSTSSGSGSGSAKSKA